MRTETPPIREISEEDLREVLRQHKAWLESEGRSGARAVLARTSLKGRNLNDLNLEGADLRGADLSPLDVARKDTLERHPTSLQKVILRRASLSGANLSGADLNSANLEGADLSEVIAPTAFFMGADMRGANLDDADLEGTNLQKANLAGARCRRTRFTRCILTSVSLRKADCTSAAGREAILNSADLSDATFERADLSGCNLENANLGGTLLSGASLADVNMPRARGLLAGQLANVDVAGARLPQDIHRFGALLDVGEGSKSAARVFYAMLLAIAYSLLAIATTTDTDLVLGAGSSPLPLIGIGAPKDKFLLLVPMIILSLFAYFHLILQYQWESLSTLPAIFPDGIALDRKVSFWLIASMLYGHVGLLQREPRSLSRIRIVLVHGLGWWLAPATIAWVWLVYLRLQDLIGSIFLSIAVLLAVFSAAFFYGLARTTLRRLPHERFFWRSDLRAPSQWRWGRLGWSFLLIGVLSAVSFGPSVYMKKIAAEGMRIRVPLLAAWVGYRPYLDLDGAELSKEADFSLRSARDDSLPVRGPKLGARSLIFLQAPGALMVNANLRNATLCGANLGSADLRGADLSFAVLDDAFLSNRRNYVIELTGFSDRAELSLWRLGRALAGQSVPLRESPFPRATDLTGANLRRASLRRANLQGAILEDADLSHADLRRADLRFATLKNAILTRANLQGADLRSAIGISDSDLAVAITDSGTRLPSASMMEVELVAPEDR